MRFIPLPHIGFADLHGKFVRRAMAAVALAIGVATAARAEDGGFHPLDSLLRTLDLKTDVGPAPDFVEASRPKGDPAYIPVGAPHPQAPLKVKTPAELKAAVATLDAARVQHDQISGRKPPVPKAQAGKKAAAATPVSATQN